MHPRGRMVALSSFVVALVSAQSDASELTSTLTGSSSASTTSSALPQVHTVQVGKADNKFVPDAIEANVGDIVEFQFYPTNHSVVRAEYEYPCIPYEMTGTDKVGFFSGFHPVDLVLDDPPSWNITINDTNPIFYYCSAPGSCITYGMVGVINPNKSVSLQHQRDLAEKSDFMLQPGEPFPAEASSSLASLISVMATSTPTSSPTSTGSPAATSTAAAAASKQGGISTGAVAGIAVGSAAVALLVAALLYFVWRSRKLAQKVNYGPMHTAVQPGAGQQTPQMPVKGPAVVESGDTIFVPIKRSDLRNSTFSSTYGDAPPYDGTMARSEDLASPYPRTGSPGQGQQVHAGYGPSGGGRPQRFSDYPQGDAFIPYPLHPNPNIGPHEMDAPKEGYMRNEVE